jgi:hypothetical protein
MFKIKGLEGIAGLIGALMITYYGVGIYKHIQEVKQIKKADNNNN